MAATTFGRLQVLDPPEVLEADENEEGVDYTLRFSGPFSIDDVTVPTGFRRVVAGEYEYGYDTAVGDFSGPPPDEAEGLACDLLFVLRAEDPPDRTVVRLKVGCGSGRLNSQPPDTATRSGELADIAA